MLLGCVGLGPTAIAHIRTCHDDASRSCQATSSALSGNAALIPSDSAHLGPQPESRQVVVTGRTKRTWFDYCQAGDRRYPAGSRIGGRIGLDLDQ